MGKIIERVRERERTAAVRSNRGLWRGQPLGAADFTILKPAVGEILIVKPDEVPALHRPWWAFWRRNGDGPVVDPLLATLLLLAAAMGAIGLYGGYF
jgi:hypothetical protein